MRKNCPNCGAAVESMVCKYCNTPLYTVEEAFNNLMGKTAHVWYEHEGALICFDICVNHLDTYLDSTTVYANGFPEHIMFGIPEMTITGYLTEVDGNDWHEQLKQIPKQERGC